MPPPDRIHAPHPTRDGAPKLGFELYAAHLLSVWMMAPSNILQGVLMLWALIRGWRWHWPWRAARPMTLPMMAYIVLLVVSAFASLEPRTSFGDLSEVFALSTFFLGLALVRGEQRVRQLFNLLIVMSVALAAYGIFQYYASGYGELENRIRGTLSHYQTFSGILLIGNLLLLSRLICSRDWRRPWSWIALAVISFSMILSLTRGSWVALGGAFMLYVFVHHKRFLLMAGSAALLLLLLAPDGWRERMRSITDLKASSNYDRLCMLDAGLYMISERPLFGIGPGMVESRYPIYRHPTAPRFTLPHLHNAFLQLAAERGLLSLVVYLWLMGAGMWLAYRGYRDGGGRDGPAGDLYLGIMTALLAFCIAGFFEDNWGDTEVQRLVLFLLAAPVCLAIGASPRAEPSKT